MNDTSVCEGSSAVWSVVMIEWLSYEWTPPMFDLPGCPFPV